VVVRLDNGSLQTVTLADEPNFKVGDQVKLDNGVIVRR
jgi:hypothetical protein